VAAFALGASPDGLGEQVEDIVPIQIENLQATLEALAQWAATAAVFSGKFWKQEIFAVAEGTDAVGRHLTNHGFGDIPLRQMLVNVLEGLGMQVLDQRAFLAEALLTAPSLTRRKPSPVEWDEVRAGLRVARALAAFHVGQTVVQARGVTVAVEAMEGTDETIRRGTRLAGPGAVIVKAIAPDNDYRFDVPTVGPATLEAAAGGEAAVLAIERGRVLLMDRAEVIRLAEEAGIALVGVDRDG
jgi:DUF1009 family protein